MIAESLRSEIEAYADQMRRSALLQSAQAGDVPPSTVLAYLVGVLHLIRDTPLLLERARDRAAALGDHGLAEYFESKLREESGHDRWAENDVQSVSSVWLVEAPKSPLPAVVELLGYLRTAIDDDPSRYLAYILFAEYFTVLLGPEWLAALEDRCGVPTTSMTVIAHHVELDKAHVEDGLVEIDDLVRDPRQFPSLRETLRQSMHYFSRFYDELLELAA